MKEDKEILIIIDGNALVHRSFHALPTTMKRHDGLTTNAVYGFTSFLLKAISEFKPQYAVVTFDETAPTFRHKVYKEYKATRVKAPDELYEQIPLTKEVLEAFEIPIFSQAGFEADDLIGTICQKVKNQKNLLSYIITGDLDTLQLVNKQVNIYTMSRGLSDPLIYDEAKIKERYNLRPDQIVDYKALRGDPSDNIPGVKGIGEKTAINLLNEYETLENVYKNIADAEKEKKISPRIASLLQEHRADAFFSKELATIKIDSPLEFNLQSAKLNFSRDKVAKIFSEMEFRSLLNRLPGKPENDQIQSLTIKKRPSIKSHLIKTEADFKNFFKLLNQEKSFAISPELNEENKLSGLNFAWQDNEAYHLSINNERAQADLFQTKNSYLEKLKDILEDSKIKKTGHDLKLIWHLLKTQKITLRGLDVDLMIASYLLDPGRRKHDLQTLIFTEFGLENLPEERSAEAVLVWRLKKVLSERLKKEKLLELYLKIEQPLISVLGQMEENGIKLELAPIKKLNKTVSEKLKKLEINIYKLAKGSFNINSPKQLQEILFEKLSIPATNVKKTKTGYSTAEDQLEKLKDLHPIISLLQDYRELNKLQTTYLNALPNLINPLTGRIHTNFNQTITATGRLSSAEPNLQNIPTKTAEGQEIRRAFTAEVGFKLLGFDYSQIELRLAAHMSGDKKMIKAFQEEKDIHTATAAGINGVALNAVTKTMRQEAKAVNFGILYGQGPHGLSQNAGIPYWQANEFIKKYFEVYPGIKKMMDNSISEAQKNGYAVTLFGRKRPLPEINSTMPMVRRGAERMAINTPLQGTAADMIKLAMIKIAELIKGHEDDIRLLLQVHDELIFEVKSDKLKTYSPQIKEIMQNIIKLRIPITVSENSGDNWGELK